MKFSFFVVLAFLYWSSAFADPAVADPADAVTVQLKWRHQFQFAGFYAAKEKGFYRDAGLDVTLIEAEPGVDPALEVISGRAQFGVGTSELVLNRYRGDAVVVLGVIFQHSPLCLVTMADSGIDNIHKLVGRRVMIEPSSAELFAYLQQEGFTQKAFELQHHSLGLNDLLSGKTDAMSIYVTDELYTLKQSSRAFNQFFPRMSGIDFYGDNFFTVESELEHHPGRVKAFREATLKGWRYAMHNPEEIIQLIYDRYSQRHSLEHLRFEARAMRDLMQPELIDPGYMNPGRWQHIANTYRQLGLLPDHFDVESMLYFASDDPDLEQLKNTLYWAIAGLTLLSSVSLVLFRFYRRAHINEARLNTMFDHAPLSLVVLDEKNRIQGWNTEAAKTFLWRADDIIGESALTLVPPEQHAELETIFDNVHRHHLISRSESVNVKQDGSEILCEWLNAPFKDLHDQSSYIICMARDITEQKRLEKQLEQAAHYDNLTSLPNRALILALLKQSLATAARQKSKLALLFLDLDGFKAINDTYGHDAGDLLLASVAQRLSQSIRTGDYAGRLAGDEFLVILQDVDSHENAELVADKLRLSIERPIVSKLRTFHTSASIGISLFPDDAIEIEALIDAADRSMYSNKQARKQKTPVKTQT
ncbi:MAG: ABC transporter substrate-binding protein [Methylomicrobium sp.]